jgi:uncharacterized protein YjiS (DUF1127 family)
MNRAIAARDQQASAPLGCITLPQRKTTMLISLIALVRRYARYRSELDSISQLDERTLRDIGINRGELASSAWRNSAPRQYP